MRTAALALGLLTAIPALASPPQQVLLKGVVAEVDQIVQAGAAQPVVVFDLDATLFDNRLRTHAILQAWVAQPALANTATAKAVLGLKVAQVQYGVGATLAQVGVTDPKVINQAVAFWLARFFGPWAVHDRAMAGGVAYVQRLRAAGAFVVYLTGRDAPRMLSATVQSLAISGYPVGVNGTQLIMKPSKDDDDEVFKASVMATLRRTGRVVAMFDNEPGNVNLMKQAFPKAQVIFLDTMHRPKAPAVAAGIPAVRDFRVE
jgi:hypothetical protein